VIRHRAEIAATLRELPHGHFATFAAPNESFVQVAIGPDGSEAVCEAVDFRSWPEGGYEEHAVTPEMVAQLVRLGFEESPGENFQRRMRWTGRDSADQVAELFARTLHTVYGVEAWDLLEVITGEGGELPD
jgi:hypothetical protein